MARSTRIAAAEKRLRILLAAARLMGRYGFERVLVRDVCAEACVHKAAASHYFHKKDALIEAVFEEAIRRIDEVDVARTLGGTTPVDTEDLLRTLFQDLTEPTKPWVLQLVVQAYAHPGTRYERSAARLRQAYASRLRAIGETLLAGRPAS